MIPPVIPHLVHASKHVGQGLFIRLANIRLANMMFTLSCALSSTPLSPDLPKPRLSPDLGVTHPPYEKISLTLDPLAYRSSSQGPITPEELQPASQDDYNEIESVIHRTTRTHGWAPVIPQYKRSMKWAWGQWEFTITERLWKIACNRMLVPLALLLVTHWLDPRLNWWNVPAAHRFSPPLLAIANGWNYLLTLTTFVTTFFVSHSHECALPALNRSCLESPCRPNEHASHDPCRAG